MSCQAVINARRKSKAEWGTENGCELVLQAGWMFKTDRMRADMWVVTSMK